MELLNSLLFWVHLAGLSLSGAAAFGLPVVGAQLAGATPEGRASLVKAIMLLSKLGGIGLGLLILSGLVLIWSRFGGPGAMSPVFWVKMGVGAGLVVLVILSRRNAAKAMSGDRAAAARQPKLALTGIAVQMTIILLAVLAFG